jgi:septum site-determining protein MinC
MTTHDPLVQIRGQKDGLWIFLRDHASPDEVFVALEQKLTSANNFFAGAEVMIHTGAREFSRDEIERLYELIERRHALQIKTIEHGMAGESQEFVGPTAAQEAASDERSDGEDPEDAFMQFLDETFRIPIDRARQRRETDFAAPLYEDNNEKTFYFRGTVRSGQSLEYPGNIVIIGDVNPGAYVVASGDILVMGRLKGVVHAGAEGQEDAVVIGAGFFPSQLRIAQYIGRPPDEYPHTVEHQARTEKASVKDGAIMIEPLL